jgi:predicted TIM-barrel enzyme
MTSRIILAALASLLAAAAPAPVADDTVMLTALGYTIGESLLVTHMAVGTLADAVGTKTYTAKQATSFVDTYINITQGMREHMTKLAGTGLSKDDAQFVQDTIRTADKVVVESNDLKKYIASTSQANAEAYANDRKQALKEVNALLGIKD